MKKTVPVIYDRKKQRATRNHQNDDDRFMDEFDAKFKISKKLGVKQRCYNTRERN